MTKTKTTDDTNIYQMTLRNFDIRYLLITAASLLLLVTVGCSDASENYEEPTYGPYSKVIRIGADVSGQMQSRNYIMEGEVKEGQFWLTYTSDKNVLSLADVDFDKKGTEGIGIVTTSDNKELDWDMVVNQATPWFYLDNVHPELNTNSNDFATVVFGDDNPYKAAVYDSTTGSNDIQWGSLQASRGTKNLNFTLHHQLSRVIVIVTIDSENDYNKELDLEGATVKLTNLVTTPYSFNRTDGSVALAAQDATPETNNLVLVDGQTEWVLIEPDEQNDNITRYYTPDYILPPQGLANDDTRTRLVITTAKGKTYSGVVPHAMFIYQGSDNTPYPVNFSFLKEYRIILRTEISKDPPELVFAPVQVIDWVDKGEFTVDGYQAGIYSADDFYNLIKAWATYTTEVISNYGYLSENKWVFNFWNTVTLDYDMIAGKMNSSRDFEFIFNNFAIYLNQDNTIREIKKPTELYEIVTTQPTTDTQ